jgi:hypothetical protein
MKEIPLTNSSKTAKVDDEDFGRVAQFRWYLRPDGHAAAHINGREIEMGHLILNPWISEGAEGSN